MQEYKADAINQQAQTESIRKEMNNMLREYKITTVYSKYKNLKTLTCNSSYYSATQSAKRLMKSW